MLDEYKREMVTWLIIGIFASSLFYLVYDSLVATVLDNILLLSGTLCLALFPLLFYILYALRQVSE